MTVSPQLLLDTDTISMFLRGVPDVVAKAGNYLSVHSGFTFSIITRFEILRGLKVKNAQNQLARFQSICLYSSILNLTDNIIVGAADICTDLQQCGQLIGDADILIAATAIDNGLAIVTNNENHFNRIAGLQVINWNK